MGNKNGKKKEIINNKDILNKNLTLCPLIDERKLLIEKKVPGNTISCLGIINYNNKDFILLGFDYGKFEIFDSITLESIKEEHDEIKTNEYIRSVGQLSKQNFVIVSQEYIRIYVFYLDDFSSNINEGHNYYDIKLVQKFNNYGKNQHSDTIDFNVKFSKAFIFDRNLYKEYDIYEVGQIKNKSKNNYNNNKNYQCEEELIVCSKKGIFIYEKNIIENNIIKEDEENKNKFDIYSYLENWENNPYVFKNKITDTNNYDMIQVNFKYIAGTIKNYLCLYSMETYELVSKFSVKISEDCDSVIFMLKEDILCVGGEDTISLISINDFEIILVSTIKKSYRITEICILPDYNILIGMKNINNSILYDSHIEYFYQYKFFHSVNKLTKCMEYNILQVSSKLLTKNYSNITMRCLSDNRLVTIIDLEHIQVWE